MKRKQPSKGTKGKAAPKSRSRKRSPASKPVPPVPTEKKKGPGEQFTVDQVADALKAGRGLRSLAAAHLGCNRRTISRMLQRHPELRDVAHDEDEAQKDIAEGKLFEAIGKGQAWAICFYLKCKAKDRGYVERQEHSGPGGKPLLEPLDYSNLTTEELRLLAKITGKLREGADVKRKGSAD